jgi:deoxyribodipyrimidine photo-lyase
MSRTIVWFRRDLRIEDNAALLAASAHDGVVVPVYLVDWERDYEWRPGEAGRWWLRTSLAALAAALAERGAPLRFVTGDPVTALLGLARSFQVDRVVWNTVYEPGIAALDGEVAAALAAAGVESHIHPGALLVEPEHVLSVSGRPFLQFTAFWRHCLTLPEPPVPAAAPPRLNGLPLEGADAAAAGGGVGLRGRDLDDWTPRVLEPAAAWQPGETGAQSRLQRFVEEALAGYETGRDIPGIEGVSRLSPHLHFGEVSPHQVWHGARVAARVVGRRAQGSSGPRAAGAAAPEAAGEGPFLRQLGWREFAHYLLWHFPHTPWEPFRPEFARMAWLHDPEGLALWQRGATGYPLVDAGMRQLLSEGWMHNRVRMVVASFLTKDLLIPWQEGAAWFWDRLVDADLANNTLGWQWTAGSGVDAAPYFRIYNPILQAERFDSQRAYVRRWLPEAGLPAAHGGCCGPWIVDHTMARERALAAFRALRRG